MPAPISVGCTNAAMAYHRTTVRHCKLYTEAAQEYRDFETGRQHAGHSMAQNNLGCLLPRRQGHQGRCVYRGKVVPQISRSRNHHAHHNLGIMFERGLGVKPDIRKALEHYEQALNAGNVYSMNAVAWLFEQGKSVPRNPKLAVRYYTQAAERGYSMAMYNLACLYLDDVAEQDSISAMEWMLRGRTR